jgi:hypothetical protein
LCGKGTMNQTFCEANICSHAWLTCLQLYQGELHLSPMTEINPVSCTSCNLLTPEVYRLQRQFTLCQQKSNSVRARVFTLISITGDGRSVLGLTRDLNHPCASNNIIYIIRIIMLRTHRHAKNSQRWSNTMVYNGVPL